MAYIASRAEEAALAATAGSIGFRERQGGAKEDFAEQAEPAGEHSGAATWGPSAEEAGEETAGDTDEEEPPEEPLAKGRRKRVLRRSGSNEPVRRASSPEEVPVKRVAGKATQWQEAQAQPVRHTRSMAAA